MNVTKGENPIIYVVAGIICCICIIIFSIGYYITSFGKSIINNITFSQAPSSSQLNSLSDSSIPYGSLQNTDEPTNVPSNYIYNNKSDAQITTSTSVEMEYGPNGKQYSISIDDSMYCKPNYQLSYECYPSTNNKQSYKLLNKGDTCDEGYFPTFNCVSNNDEYTIDDAYIQYHTCGLDGYRLAGNQVCKWSKPTCPSGSTYKNGNCYSCPTGYKYIDGNCGFCSKQNALPYKDLAGNYFCVSFCPDGYLFLQKSGRCIESNWVKLNLTKEIYDEIVNIQPLIKNAFNSS
jgi:hypothetical protein